MQYALFLKGFESTKLNNLENLHDSLENEENNFSIMLSKFIEDNRHNSLLLNEIYIQNLVSNVRQIVFSFTEFKKAKEHIPTDKNSEDSYYQDVEAASIFVFIFNTKSFLEIVKRFTRLPIDDRFNQYLRDVTFVRDHLAHSYKKDTEIPVYSKAIVNSVIQRGFTLETLELIALNNGVPLGMLYFSLDVFYFYIKEMFEKLMNNSKLFYK